MFRFYKSEVPEFFVNFLNSNVETHDYFTWQHNHLHVPMIKSNLSKFAICYHGVIIWNSIMKLGNDPDTSEAVFVKLLKKMHHNSKATVVIQIIIMFVCLLCIELVPR